MLIDLLSEGIPTYVGVPRGKTPLNRSKGGSAIETIDGFTDINI